MVNIYLESFAIYEYSGDGVTPENNTEFGSKHVVIWRGKLAPNGKVPGKQHCSTAA